MRVVEQQITATTFKNVRFTCIGGRNVAACNIVGDLHGSFPDGKWI